VTCFPSWFEKEIMTEADFVKLLPFDMETRLKERGADLRTVDKETFSNSTIADSNNRIVTASAADGGKFIAAQVIEWLSPKKNH